MEIVRVTLDDREILASGTQIGVSYELRYELEATLIRLELVGVRSLEVSLDDFDFFDLGFSPLFNSLPVLRDGLLERGAAADYVMRWISVPDLELHESQQRYEPLDRRVVRFTAGTFAAEIRFDDDGLVQHYEGLAERLA